MIIAYIALKKNIKIAVKEVGVKARSGFSCSHYCPQARFVSYYANPAASTKSKGITSQSAVRVCETLRNIKCHRT